MFISLIITFLLILGVTVFALQNSRPLEAPVTFLMWNFGTSLVAVVFSACTAGIIIGLVFTLPSLIRKHIHERKLVRLAREWEERCGRLERELTQRSEGSGTTTSPRL